jgi:BASS family bile acid:Na+ symporter
MDPTSGISLAFSPTSLRVLNACLAFIMFGVALSIEPAHFKEVLTKPKAILTGVASQLILLPALTFLLVLIIRPPPAIALGMFLVAACPGGNVSIYFSLLGKGNVALSVSLTAVSSFSCFLTTPFIFSLLGSRYGPTTGLLRAIDISFVEIFVQILLVLTVPLLAGLLTARMFPKLTGAIAGPIKHLSFLMLLGFIVVAFSANARQFLEYIHLVFGLVLLHNAGALGSGYALARGLDHPPENRRSIAIETGIQNTGLGLVIIFNFFDGFGGMAIVAAWWGIWHLLAGMAVAQLFAHQDRRNLPALQGSPG